MFLVRNKRTILDSIEQRFKPDNTSHIHMLLAASWPQGGHSLGWQSGLPEKIKSNFLCTLPRQSCESSDISAPSGHKSGK